MIRVHNGHSSYQRYTMRQAELTVTVGELYYHTLESLELSQWVVVKGFHLRRQRAIRDP